jgi:2-polyprenyl-6-methoxyphenol hydroxylase-like FAD-dependent oxidoreductase
VSINPAPLLVGAGPAGLTAAAELMRHGVGVRIVDKAAAPTTVSKAVSVQARTLEVLHDLGIVDELIARGHVSHGLSIYTVKRRIVHFRYDEIDSPFPFVLNVSQAVTEAVLAELVARLGATVEREVELMSFTQDATGVDATLRHGDGREEVVRTPYLLGFDGARSTVRKALGIEFIGKTLPGWYALADVRIEWGLGDDELHGFVHPHGLLFGIPLAGGWTRLVIETAEHEADAGFTHEELQRLMDERGPGDARITEVGWMAPFNVNSRRAEHFRSGRVFIGGDAAHIHSPAGGQGLNTSVQDAYNLSWKLALVLAGGAGESLLDSYEAERAPVASTVLKSTERLTRMLTLHTAPARAVRDHVMPLMTGIQRVGTAIATEAAEIDITYRHSPIVREHHRHGLRLHESAPRAGDRAPDVQGLEHDGEPASLHDVLCGTQHVLLALGSDDAGVAASVAERYGDRVRLLVVNGDGLRDPDGALHRRYHADSPVLYLVRPDGYLGFVSRPADGDALLGFLDDLFVGGD